MTSYFMGELVAVIKSHASNLDSRARGNPADRGSLFVHDPWITKYPFV